MAQIVTMFRRRPGIASEAGVAPDTA